MSRSAWKTPSSTKSIFNDFYLHKNINKSIYSSCRGSVIFPIFVGSTIHIYNGKNFISLQIKETMIGHKIGEFVSTRKKPIHKKK
jgi:small subunit ribosomal protein S19